MNVLFVCVGNSGRSLMAERLFLRAAGDRHAVRSAGLQAGDAAEPAVLEALREVGIDASDHLPRQLDDEALAWADVAVTLCEAQCPVTPGFGRSISSSTIRTGGRSRTSARSETGSRRG